ncbi:MAG: DUF3784 domain-containing protein [Bacteroidales bacterium]|nr:DUF3784 domain-containing protein [Bacteroidales bacterium]
MTAVFFVNIGMGLLFILIGWLCYRYPNLINPYGSLPPERKALVDIEGLKKAVAITMAATGFLLVITGVLAALRVIGEDTGFFAMGGLCLAMVVPLFLFMWKYNGYGRDRTGSLDTSPMRNLAKLPIVITAISIVFVITLVAMTNKSTKIDVDKEAIHISGMYGRDIPLTSVVSAKKISQLPPVAMRTNGTSTGKYNKGHYLLKNGEKCMMFVRKQPPYIELRTSDGGLYYLNGANGAETQLLAEIIIGTLKHISKDNICSMTLGEALEREQ